MSALHGCTGSPPRVRGIHGCNLKSFCAGRFTPACTGNTVETVVNSLPERGSPPRVRGILMNLCLQTLLIGSPPRVRGIRLPIRIKMFLSRFTPACTGNTMQPQTKMALNAVHPRVYGEYFMRLCVYITFNGSPPRVRGIRQRKRGMKMTDRFTPACTGNTLEKLNANNQPRFTPACTGNTDNKAGEVGQGTVHPRVYGEY